MSNQNPPVPGKCSPLAHALIVLTLFDEFCSPIALTVSGWALVPRRPAGDRPEWKLVGRYRGRRRLVCACGQRGADLRTLRHFRGAIPHVVRTRPHCESVFRGEGEAAARSLPGFRPSQCRPVLPGSDVLTITLLSDSVRPSRPRHRSSYRCPRPA